MALLLQRRGITRIRPLAGGLEGWRERGLPLERLSWCPLLKTSGRCLAGRAGVRGPQRWPRVKKDRHARRLTTAAGVYGARLSIRTLFNALPQAMT